MKRRIVAAIVGLLALVLVVTGVLVVGMLRQRLVSNVDDQLMRRAAALQRPATRFPGGERFRGSPFVDQRAAFVELGSSGEVVDAIPMFHDSQPEPLPDVAGITLSSKPRTVGSVAASGPRYRALVVRVADVTIVAAMPLTDVDSTVRSAEQVLLVGAVVTLVAAAAFVWLTVRRGLEPIDAMIGTAERIAAGDLSERAAVPDPGSEVGHLGAALNTMLDNIEEAVAGKTASEARLRRFVADASHELRTPLTSIRGYAELYRRGADDPESVRRGMERIEHEATRMGALVEDLLLLARLDQRLEARTDPVNLGLVVADAVDAARAVEPSRRITVSVPSTPLLVPGDGARLRQVVDNLFANVREHTDPGTAVTVTLEQDGADAVLLFADDGPGMSSDDAARAFERFWQGEQTLDHPRRGTGLGLAIVHDLVVSHGGTVELTSEPGGGARFTVRVPRFTGSSQPGDGSPADEPATLDA